MAVEVDNLFVERTIVTESDTHLRRHRRHNTRTPKQALFDGASVTSFTHTRKSNPNFDK